MKTLIAVAFLAGTALSFSVEAEQMRSASNLIDAAQAYLTDNGQYVKQGYFMGMVQFYGDSVPNCVPDGVPYSAINQAVAGILVNDPKTSKLVTPFLVIDYAVNKAFPCTKS